MSNLKELKNKLSSLKSEQERFEREIETNKARKDDPNWIHWNQFSSEKNQRLDREISRFSDALKEVTR
ncbi:MAG: hypothetical protein F6K08_02205 [Okeania sp. SIO1H6]|nr:hypothetical protein [Okeania sp. SIO1H6]